MYNGYELPATSFMLVALVLIINGVLTMKKTILTATALSVIALSASALEAKDSSLTEGLYVSGTLGWLMPNDSDALLAGAVQEKADNDNTLSFSAALGKRFNDHVRAEFELGYAESDYKFTGALAGNTGESETLTALINGYYDFMPEKKLSPYLSAGIGFARQDITVDPPAGTGGSDSDTVLAYQLGAGATYDLNQTWDMQMGYRFLGTSDAKFDDGSKSEYRAHEIRIGAIYNF
jgi:opacity protein-like surface antigen